MAITSIVFIVVNCARNLPPVRTLSVAEISEDESNIQFSLQTPKRNSSKEYWSYKFGLIPSGGHPPEKGYILIECLTDKTTKKYFFESFEKSSWSHPQTSYLMNLREEVFEDEKKYNVSIFLNQPSKQKLKVVLYYMSH